MDPEHDSVREPISETEQPMVPEAVAVAESHTSPRSEQLGDPQAHDSAIHDHQDVDITPEIALAQGNLLGLGDNDSESLDGTRASSLDLGHHQVGLGALVPPEIIWND